MDRYGWMERDMVFPREVRERRRAHPRVPGGLLTVAIALLALMGPAAHARVAPEIKCKDVKAKAAGKRAFMLLKAFTANEKKPNPSKFANATAKAHAKFAKAFSKAEAKGTCRTVGDADAVAATTDAYVTSTLEQLSGQAGTTTTTSTSTSTSTTSIAPTTTTTLPPGSGKVVISEVLYDPSGSDDGFEWVELRNTRSMAVDLSTYSLGYGGSDYTGGTFQLSGSIPAGATFVVGGPASDASNGSPIYDLSLDFSPDLQNSGTIGDGVALFDVLASEITGATVPIDAVVYGPNNDNGLLDESGVVNPPEVDDAPSGSSIERLDAAGAWQVQGTPTPNATPF